MLIGFERITADLTAKDLPAARAVGELLLMHKGKDRAINNAAIRAHLASLTVPNRISPVKVRKIIHALRMHDIVKCIVSASAGYWISDNIEELEDCIESLKQRQRSILLVQMAIQRQLNGIRPPEPVPATTQGTLFE